MRHLKYPHMRVYAKISELFVRFLTATPCNRMPRRCILQNSRVLRRKKHYDDAF
jgi:hypothetical protein